MGLLEAAAGIFAQAPVCDACAGRVFADWSHGLANAERGRALRVACALDADEPFEPPTAEDCWVCEGTTQELDEWARWAANELAAVTFETYQVGTRVPPLFEENDRLLREEAGLAPDAGEPFKREFNREVRKRLGDMVGGDVDFERPDVQVTLDLASEHLSVDINSAFVYGRYRKLERGIPQTKWPCRDCHGTGTHRGEPCENCDGVGKLYPTSVEELVAPHIQDAMDGTAATFHGAGREDVDARMLGTGRPFVVEVDEPRDRFPDVDQLTALINEAATGRVEVDSLALATYEIVERVKELDASKTYEAAVSFDSPVSHAAFAEALDALGGQTVSQETPTRVSHRRAAKTRTRTVYAIEGTLQDEHSAVIEIHGEGGLYIKELLHGDEGRTTPSLAGLLGVGVQVDSLDVLAVDPAGDEAFADPEFLRTPPPES